MKPGGLAVRLVGTVFRLGENRVARTLQEQVQRWKRKLISNALLGVGLKWFGGTGWVFVQLPNDMMLLYIPIPKWHGRGRVSSVSHCPNI